MRLQTINAPNMKTAMEMIRSSLGEEAIILSSTEVAEGNGITVTVAIEQEENEFNFSNPFISDASLTLPEALENIEEILRFHATPEHIFSKILETARHLCLQGKDINIDMTRLMAACFHYAPLPLNQENYTLMLVGPPGTGKTMTVAKMASQLVMEKKKPVVITTDNKRAGGVEQLSSFTTILGLELHVADSRSELWRLLKQYAPHQRILIDTGGVNPYNNADLKEIADYIKLDRSIEPVLVAAAGSDSAEADDTARSFATLGVKRLLVTRIDTARRYGSVLASAFGSKLAFSHASNSSRIIGEFATIDPVTLAQLLLRYQQKET